MTYLFFKPYLKQSMRWFGFPINNLAMCLDFFGWSKVGPAPGILSCTLKQLNLEDTNFFWHGIFSASK